MASVASQVQERLRELKVEAQLYQLGRAKAARRALERQLSEVQQRVPFWDRVVFFSDTADEAEVRRLKAALEQLDAQAAAMRSAADVDLDAIAAEFVPYRLAREIDKIGRLIHGSLRVEGRFFKDIDLPEELFERLEALASDVARTWVVGFELEEVVRTLADDARCEELARQEPPRPTPDDQLGHAPITQEELLVLLAGHVASGPYLQRRGEVERQREALRALVERSAAARDAVSFWEKLNVFSAAPAEQQRDALAAEVPKALERLRHLNEEAHHTVESALTAWPPLLIVHHTSELLGALRSTMMAEERNLNPDGAVATYQLPSSRALVFATLGRLKRGFARAFPGIPLPSDVEARAGRAAEAESGPAPSAQLMEGFGRAMERANGEEALERCLRRVTMRQRLGERLEGLGRAISFWDRLSLDDTEDQRTEADLHARRKWLERATDAGWQEVLQVARQAGATLPQLALRDWAVAASLHLDAVHTDGGSSSAPKSCSVYGRGEVNSALSSIAQTIQHTWDLRGNRQELIEALAARLASPLPDQLPEGFRPRDWDETLLLLAFQLRGTSFQASAHQLQDLQPQRETASAELREVVGRISFWDRLNVFTDTPEEQRRDVLEDALDQLNQQTRQEAHQLNDALDRALSSWPPAAIYYSIGQVHTAVANIRAVCRSRTVSTGTGKNRTTRTEYYCALEGKPHAFAQMRAWNARYVQLFGEQPGYHELLAQWGTRL